MSETSSTIERLVLLLELLSELGTATPQELAEQLGVSRSSVQRLIVTLERRGFLVRTPGGYGLSTYVRVIADVVLRSLRSAADNVMRTLAERTHETVVLYVPDGEDMVVLDEAFTTEQPMRVRHPIGSRVPMMQSASGLVYVAHTAHQKRDHGMGAESQGRARLVHLAKAQGYLLGSTGQLARMQEIAVPVLDQSGAAVASLSIMSPDVRADRLLPFLPELQESAKRITRVRRSDDEDRRP